jgi:hypothetical protein
LLSLEELDALKAELDKPDEQRDYYEIDKLIQKNPFFARFAKVSAIVEEKGVRVGLVEKSTWQSFSW